MLHRFTLYELAVTDAPRLARFILAAHGRSPRTLREDFSGSGALARAWPGLVPGGAALAVDLEAEPLRHAKAPGVRTLRADVLDCPAKADVIAATNFPLGYFHTRPELLAYLKHARRCLNPKGILLADLYGGRDALTPLTIRRKLRGPRGERIEYTWEQREADPATNLVLDTLSFKVAAKPGAKPRVLKDAFVYRWRLWSIPELRDALTDAGFRAVDLYSRMGDAVDGDGNLYVRPHDASDELDENYVVYVVGRR